MNLGVETLSASEIVELLLMFQHSLMNLGVETFLQASCRRRRAGVSAFSDESWGGDPPCCSICITAPTGCFSIL